MKIRCLQVVVVMLVFRAMRFLVLVRFWGALVITFDMMFTIPHMSVFVPMPKNEHRRAVYQESDDGNQNCLIEANVDGV